MMPSRSALLLLSCMTCLGFARNAVGAQVNAYSTHKPTLLPDLPLALVVPIGTTRLLASLTVADIDDIVAQRRSPTPTDRLILDFGLPILDDREYAVQAASFNYGTNPKPKIQNPKSDDTIPDFSFGKQKPTTKTTQIPKSSKSYWALWWIGTGTVLIVIAGGLLYLLRHSDEQKEPIAQEQPPKPESFESGSSENSNLDASNSQPNSFELQLDKNGYNNGASSVLENKHPDESISQSQVEPNSYNSGISWSSENKHSEESTPVPLADVSSYNSGVSPIADNKNLEQSTAVPQTEALEVREPTRLPKINIVDELIKDLQNPDPTKRRKAIWELAQRGDSRAMQPLLELLMDADSKQRSLILEALSQIGTRTLKPVNRALAISLQDENAEVRKNAIRDLTRIYDMMAQVSQLLRHAIDDPDAEVQETARWALTQLSRIRGLPATDNLSNRPNSKNPPEN